MKTLTRAIAFGFIFAPVLAEAHPGHSASGLTSGFAHPLTGWDHLLAMVAVGLWAAQLGGRARWQVPAAFVGVMILGGLAGMGGVVVPAVEQGIIASVLVFGVLIAAAVRLPVSASMAIVGVFAFFHGVAHGTEMPAGVNGLNYAAGFTLATALLHLGGLSLGMMGARAHQPRLVRAVGGAMAVCALLLGVS